MQSKKERVDIGLTWHILVGHILDLKAIVRVLDRANGSLHVEVNHVVPIPFHYTYLKVVLIVPNRDDSIDFRTLVQI